MRQHSLYLAPERIPLFGHGRERTSRHIERVLRCTSPSLSLFVGRGSPLELLHQAGHLLSCQLQFPHSNLPGKIARVECLLGTCSRVVRLLD